MGDYKKAAQALNSFKFDDFRYVCCVVIGAGQGTTNHSAVFH